MQQMFWCEIIHFKRLPLSENVNEYNSVDYYGDSVKAVGHRNTISPRAKLNIWLFY